MLIVFYVFEIIMTSLGLGGLVAFGILGEYSAAICSGVFALFFQRELHDTKTRIRNGER